MSFEVLVGMQVTDELRYQEYRNRMTPLLEAAGGGFRYDFRVSETLQGDLRTINRLFAIYFPDAAARDAFFARPDYLAIRQQWWMGAVGDRVVIAEYTR